MSDMLAKFREAQLPGVARLRKLAAEGTLPAPRAFPGGERPGDTAGTTASGGIYQ